MTVSRKRPADLQSRALTPHVEAINTGQTIAGTDPAAPANPIEVTTVGDLAAPSPVHTRPAADKNKSMTVYVSEATRRRSRAAFQATQYPEGDESWSAFVEKAILSEVVRREKLHNGGREFTGGDVRLRAGRPLS